MFCPTLPICCFTKSPHLLASFSTGRGPLGWPLHVMHERSACPCPPKTYRSDMHAKNGRARARGRWVYQTVFAEVTQFICVKGAKGYASFAPLTAWPEEYKSPFVSKIQQQFSQLASAEQSAIYKHHVQPSDQPPRKNCLFHASDNQTTFLQHFW